MNRDEMVLRIERAEVQADEEQRKRREQARLIQRCLCNRLIFVHRMMSRPQCGAELRETAGNDARC